MEHTLRLGILGGGQLGRMSALAAARLGISVVIFTPEDHSPASLVAADTVVATYDDEGALQRFAGMVDVISYEFENIPVETVAFLKKLKPVYPDERLLEVSQDRVAEKSFLNAIDIPTARWAAPKTPEEALKHLEEWGVDSCIFKTVRFGYDGKGQARYTGNTNIETLWTQFNSSPLIMEEVVDFDCEISVIVARDQNKNMVVYGPMLNEHKNHILARTVVPAGINAALAEESIKLIKKLADQIDLTGVLTLELFVTKDGRLLANEIAPRTHNSGHWSIDACAVSQFENHVRCVCGLPVGAPERHSDVEMLNLIGDEALKIAPYYDEPGACVHLYGKTEVREGRKMGHVTRLREQTQPL